MNIHKILVLAICIVALSACGIDSYVYLNSISAVTHWPGETQDDLQNYLEFSLPNSQNNDYLEFKGYEIYYKIYSSESKKSTDLNNINTVNENNPTTIHSYLTNTKKYQRLSSSTRRSEKPLIRASNSNDKVYIRLLNDSTFTVGGEDLGVPSRTQNGFYDKDFSYSTITTGEVDVDTSAESSPELWYVQFFGFAYGLEGGVYSIYSSVCYLGTLTIKKPL